MHANRGARLVAETTAGEPVARKVAEPAEPPGSEQELEYFYEHLERALDSRGYLDGEMREVTIEVTMMKMRRLFGRSRPSSGEIKMLRTLMRFIHRDGD
jgi:tRNA C32,U32 (ribose-2'-O)-methylase TrmJ